MKKILFLLFCTITLISCNSDDDNKDNTDAQLTFTFTHNFDGRVFNRSSLNITEYTNQHGNVLKIARLRYLISNIKLERSTGNDVVLEGYHLVDVSREGTLSFSPSVRVPKGTYTNISFIFGLEEENNISNQYNDLNSVSWNWPEDLGGGYHFMQMDDFYDGETPSSPFNFHHGTARKSAGVFEQNYFEATLDGTTINNNAQIEIKMNVAEWFKNPNTWDLNVYDTNLMMNYTAQKLIQQNGATVFKLGEVTQ